MKSLINLFTSLSLIFFISSCGQAPEGKEAKTEAPTEANTAKAIEGADTYYVDTDNSVIGWKATKLMGGGQNGSIKVSAGNLYIKNDEIVGGKFTIDMNSIEELSLEDPDRKARIESHLKSDDFFATATYPTATFEITETTSQSENNNGRQEIKGNLTIKGISKNITFFSRLIGSNSAYNVTTGFFTIDRTEWGVNYNSGVIGTVQDKIINDKIAIDINLTVKK